MEKYRVSHNGEPIQVKIDLERSKSIANRALLIRALCEESFDIHHLSTADDTKTLDRLLQSDEALLDVGAAGTTMRFLVAYLSMQEGREVVITGSERMQNRPIGVLVDVLRQLGADIENEAKEGYPPLRIKGKALSGGTIQISAGISSQYISAIMMIAPKLKGGLTIELEGDIVSLPYIKMTLALMNYFGVQSTWLDKRSIEIKEQSYSPKSFTVESDWSSSSYWFEIIALAPVGSKAELIGLQMDSLQGDNAIEEIMAPFGVMTRYTENGVLLEKINASKDFIDVVDMLECPDLAQTVVPTFAAFGQSQLFEGLLTLKIKETDRVTALKNELAKMGASFEELEFNQSWKVSGQLQEGEVSIRTYEDHRMAMAFAPLSIKTGSIVIEEPMVVTKSYPEYWSHLAQAGYLVESV